MNSSEKTPQAVPENTPPENEASTDQLTTEIAPNGATFSYHNRQEREDILRSFREEGKA